MDIQTIVSTIEAEQERLFREGKEVLHYLVVGDKSKAHLMSVVDVSMIQFSTNGHEQDKFMGIQILYSPHADRFIVGCDFYGNVLFCVDVMK